MSIFVILKSDVLSEKEVRMTDIEIIYHKGQCKLRKKLFNMDNLTLMQIQHRYAVEQGFKSWSDFIHNG